MFAATDLGTSATGYVRATGLAPRDSTPTVAWSLDRSGALLSPNDDGQGDGLVVAARLSERVEATLTVRNAGGSVVWSKTAEADIVRFSWDLTNDAGNVVHDGAYTWTLKARDDWGNPGVTANGGFTLDATPPTSKATQSSTEGLDGWRVSPVDIRLTATDALSGVRSISYRLDGGAAKTYGDGLRVSANGKTTVEYRATDKAGIREPWHQLTFRIDTRAPTIGVAMSGTAGDVAGIWRGAVTLKPSFADGGSGVAGRLVSVDGGPATALSGESVVVKPDGTHVVAFTATDVAGNQATVRRSFTIDTVAPVVTADAGGSKPATVTPNGDAVGEVVGLPFTVSEASTVTARIAGPGGTAVRTLSADGGAGRISWDGRTATGRPVPDGRYTVALTARDAAGNVGEPATLEVDVYAALASVTRSPTLFYPQDGDALARSSTVSFRLLSPATVTVKVLDARGDVVRTAYADRALAAGPVDLGLERQGDRRGVREAGPLPDRRDGHERHPAGGPVHHGRGGRVPSRRVGDDGRPRPRAHVDRPVRRTAVDDAGRRGQRGGRDAWTVRMTKTTATTWTATITPRRAGDPGTLGLTVKARDEAGGRNASTLKLGLARRSDRETDPLPGIASGGTMVGSILLPRAEVPEVPEMTMRTAPGHGSQRRWRLERWLPASEDASRGASNLATIPRAGNYSSDTRAG